MKGPSSSMPGYLEGDTVIFSCFQDHITKGDTDYQCLFSINLSKSIKF